MAVKATCGDRLNPRRFHLPTCSSPHRSARPISAASSCRSWAGRAVDALRRPAKGKSLEPRIMDDPDAGNAGAVSCRRSPGRQVERAAVQALAGGNWRRKKKESADKPGFVVGSHSSGSCVAAGFKQPTRERRGPRHSSPIWSCSRWGLPCHAALTPHAVRSYRTVSPLPRASCDAVRRFAFCCTFRRLAPPRHYLAPCPAEPGLSSPCRNTSRLPGRLQCVV